MIVPSTAGRQFVCVGAALMMAVVPLVLPRDHLVHAGEKLDKAKRSWPMFGGSPGRNMVNTSERNLPATWCVEAGKRKNVKWLAELGDRTLGSPIVANGKVFVATNFTKLRDSQVKGPKAVVMAFRETDGQFLWQNAHDLPEFVFATAVPSTPAVDGSKLYYITPTCEVICA